MRQYFYLIFLSLISACLLSCNTSSNSPVSKTDFLMGTYISITSYDDQLPPGKISEGIDSAFQYIRSIERLASHYAPKSLIWQLNAERQEERKEKLSGDLLTLAREAMQIASDSEGKFDFTLWPVFRLWGFDSDSAGVPAQEKISSELQFVDFQQVSLQGDSLHLPAGMMVDFSGIAKGYAVEAARTILKRHGMKNFIIDAGGNLGIEWQQERTIAVQVRHPRKAEAFWGSFPIKTSCGIATSGDYHFYFMETGKRYHHILHPETGYPVEGVVGTTIVAPNAILADGYSTAVFAMGQTAGQEFIRSRPTLEGLMITEENGVLSTWVSPGLAQFFKTSEEQ